MAKIVYASLKGATTGVSGARAKSAVTSRKVTTPDGSRVTIYTVDAESPSFGTDMTTIFRRNVARARRENRRLLGVEDDAEPAF